MHSDRLEVVESFQGRRVLVTGVTGFLGKVWLGMLLQHVPGCRAVVLIRSRKGESARQRFERIALTSPALRPLRRAYGDGFRALLDERVEVVEGDCSKPACGLDDEDLTALGKDLDAVVHFAGLTDFMPDPRDALAANVRGALNAAELAARSRGKRMIHVSTAFVAGNVSGAVPEQLHAGRSPAGRKLDPAEELAQLERICDEVPGRRARVDRALERAEQLGWPNLYTYSKALAEHLLAQRDEVRVTTVRPSIVECARTYPFAGWNEGINTSGPLVWLFSTTFRHFPSKPGHRFDVVPVDTVARGVMSVTAEALRDGANAVYHLSSGTVNPLTFGRAIELTNLGVRRMHRRNGGSALEQIVLAHLDVVPVDAHHTPVTAPPSLRWAAERGRELLQHLDAKRALPPSLYERWGSRLEQHTGELSRKLRKTERNLKRVEEMLQLYRPFIHDNDYSFVADHICRTTERLDASERARFGFDVEDLDWRHYWLEVQIPGLEKWSLPLMRGERVPQDPPPDAQAERPEPESFAPEPSTTSRVQL